MELLMICSMPPHLMAWVCVCDCQWNWSIVFIADVTAEKGRRMNSEAHIAILSAQMQLQNNWEVLYSADGP